MNISHIGITVPITSAITCSILESSIETTAQLNETEYDSSFQTEKINPTVTTTLSNMEDTFNNSSDLARNEKWLFRNSDLKEWNTTTPRTEQAFVEETNTQATFWRTSVFHDWMLSPEMVSEGENRQMDRSGALGDSRKIIFRPEVMVTEQSFFDQSQGMIGNFKRLNGQVYIHFISIS